MEIHPKCPNCNSDVHYDLTCHTWQNSDNVWMACLGCDSAILYVCDRDYDCWHYIDGLNPRNPRAQKNEAKRPSWLNDDFVDKTFGYDTRVRYIGDE